MTSCCSAARRAASFGTGSSAAARSASTSASSSSGSTRIRRIAIFACSSFGFAQLQGLVEETFRRVEERLESRRAAHPAQHQQDGGDPLRRLRRDERPAVQLDGAARRDRHGRRAVLDPASRAGAAVRQGRARRRAEFELSPEEDEAIQRPPRGSAGRRARVTRVRVAFLGPEGTFTEEALLASAGRDERRAGTAADDLRLRDGGARRDASSGRSCRSRTRSRAPSTRPSTRSVFETEEVAIVGEMVHPIQHCLIARAAAARWTQIERVVSHPQASAQCARFMRSGLPDAEVVAADSTADAVRIVAESRAALGGARQPRCRRSSTAARCWRTASRTCPRTRPASSGSRASPAGLRLPTAELRWKTSIVFWGLPDTPGALVDVLQEFAGRERQPQQDRVAAAQAGARPLHLLRRPRGPASDDPPSVERSTPSARRSKRCACSAATPPPSAVQARPAPRRLATLSATHGSCDRRAQRQRTPPGQGRETDSELTQAGRAGSA